MLEVGLCMSVRNEAANIVECLAPIAHLFAQIVVVDTGSTDGTDRILREALAIEPYYLELDESRCHSLAAVRNRGFDRLRTPWLMTLDADERVCPKELEAVLALDDKDLPAGLFCGWDTDLGDGEIIEDYKLCLFRSPHRHHGLIHDTAQPSLRASSEMATWITQMRLRHFPDPERTTGKEQSYARRLACAQRREPGWSRYDWFRGYRCFCDGDDEEASRVLRTLHEERPPLFPVESLNASMVLSAIAARRGEVREAEIVLREALDYHALVADDFEVRVNFRLEDWLKSALDAVLRDACDAVRPYPFPY